MFVFNEFTSLRRGMVLHGLSAFFFLPPPPPPPPIAGRTFPQVPSILIVTCASNITPGDGNKALRICVHYERV